MAKIEITIYKCDICKKEFGSEQSIKSESVPCYGNGTCYTNVRVDMCEACAKKIREVIYDNFAEIRYCQKLSVEKKF